MKKERLLMTLLVLFCTTLACNAAGDETTQNIGGIFYYLMKWDSMDQYGNPVTVREANVTYDPEVDPWSGNGTIDTYQGDIVIPETVDYNNETYTVVGINGGAFRNAHGITSLSLPKTIRSFDCSYITELNNLASITVDAANDNYKTDNGVLYNKAVTQILCVPTKLGGVYRIPATVTEIDNQIGRPQLDELIIPATVTRLGNRIINNNWEKHATIKKLTIEDSDNELTVGTGDYSETFYEDGNSVYIYPLFYNCAIQEVYWGRNLKYTNKYSSPFSYNGSLSEVVFGAKVTTIPKYSFLECYNVRTLDVKGGLTQWCNFDFTVPYASPFYNSYIKDEDKTVLFNGTSLSGNVVLEDAVTKIPAHAFQYGCTGITSLTLHAGVTDIADGAFRGLTSLLTIALDAGNTHFIVIDNVLYNIGVTKILCFPQLRTGDYAMPSTIAEMGDYQFYNCINLTGVTLSPLLTTINPYAFYGCTKLAGLTIPASVATIGSYAFAYCSSLTEISIPAAVSSIDNDAFDECKALTKVTFEDCDNAISLGYGNKKDEWGKNNTCGVFGSSPVETLYVGRNLEFTNKNYYDSGDGRNYQYFHFGNYLKIVNIGCRVNRIPAGMFYGCWGIVGVFYDCDIIHWCNITFEDQYATPFGANMMGSPILYLEGNPLHSQVYIPNGVGKIGAYAFYGQRGVSTFTVGTPAATGLTIEENAFNAPFVSQVIFNGASGIATLAASNAFNSEASIYVDKSLLAGYRSAANWSVLADRIFPSGFLEVTVNLTAMADSPALLPALNALEEIDGEYRIERLTNLKIKGTMNGWDFLMIRNKMINLRHLDLSEVTITDNDGGYEYYTGYHTKKRTITPYTFYQLKTLRQIDLPHDILVIEDHAFAESGITNIVIPVSVKYIGTNAFYGCGSLTSLTLQPGLVRIGDWAFANCYSLGELAFPTTLKFIDSYAFSSCSSLSKIDFAEGLLKIGSGAFQSCYNLTELKMPTSLRKISDYAFNSCNGLKEVHVPSMITNIGDYAFKNCGLKSVYAYTVVPVQINQNTFDYSGVALFAPKNSFYKYYLNTQWSQFLRVNSFPANYLEWYTPRNTDYEINTENCIHGYNEDSADGSMEPGSGLIIIGNGEQLVKHLIMNWQHGTDYPSLIDNGNLEVEELKFIMNVYPGRWYFFCFPFDINIGNIDMSGDNSGGTGSGSDWENEYVDWYAPTEDSTPKPKWIFRYYDGEARAENGSGGWKNVTDGKLKAGVGYIFQCSATGDLQLPVDNPDFLNTLAAETLASSDKEVPLMSYESSNPQDASWNLVGNPNLSYYGLEDLESDYNSPITVWDDDMQTYTAVMPGDDDYDIHPFQAFFVQTPADKNDISFRAENRATYTQTENKQANRAARRAQRRVNENRLLMNLIISDGNTSDRTRVIFNNENKMDYEVGIDASKFMSTAAVPQIYTLDGRNVKYAINARPNGNQEVRIGYVATAEGQYTISSDLLDCYMAIKDYETGNIHMLDDGAYSFFTEKGTFDNRFTLIPASSVTGISSNGIDGYDIDAVDGGITVNGIQSQTVNIYKVNGVKVASLKESGKANLANGTYIVTVGGKSTKILVK